MLPGDAGTNDHYIIHSFSFPKRATCRSHIISDVAFSARSSDIQSILKISPYNDSTAANAPRDRSDDRNNDPYPKSENLSLNRSNCMCKTRTQILDGLIAYPVRPPRDYDTDRYDNGEYEKFSGAVRQIRNLCQTLDGKYEYKVPTACFKIVARADVAHCRGCTEHAAADASSVASNYRS